MVVYFLYNRLVKLIFTGCGVSRGCSGVCLYWQVVIEKVWKAQQQFGPELMYSVTGSKTLNSSSAIWRFGFNWFETCLFILCRIRFHVVSGAGFSLSFWSAVFFRLQVTEPLFVLMSAASTRRSDWTSSTATGSSDSVPARERCPRLLTLSFCSVF